MTHAMQQPVDVDVRFEPVEVDAAEGRRRVEAMASRRAPTATSTSTIAGRDGERERNLSHAADHYEPSVSSRLGTPSRRSLARRLTRVRQ